jgi:hypothetical protein
MIVNKSIDKKEKTVIIKERKEYLSDISCIKKNIKSLQKLIVTVNNSRE